MSIPYIKINSMTYSNNVLTVNSDYSYLRGGGSFSITGFSSSLYYSKTSSYGSNISTTFSVGISASSRYNLVISFYKGPYTNVYSTGITGTVYETNRTINYIFNT